MDAPRPPRLRPVPREVVEQLAVAGEGPGEAELVARLQQALADLPAAERAAAVVAFGLDEGAAGVAVDLDLSGEDAEALTRSAVQLLRGALADVDLDEAQVYARLTGRRTPAAPGDHL